MRVPWVTLRAHLTHFGGTLEQFCSYSGVNVRVLWDPLKAPRNPPNAPRDPPKVSLGYPEILLRVPMGSIANILSLT